MWDLRSPTRFQTCVSCIARRTLNLWATREVPAKVFTTQETVLTGDENASFLTYRCWESELMLQKDAETDFPCTKLQCKNDNLPSSLGFVFFSTSFDSRFYFVSNQYNSWGWHCIVRVTLPSSFLLNCYVFKWECLSRKSLKWLLARKFSCATTWLAIKRSISPV